MMHDTKCYIDAAQAFRSAVGDAERRSALCVSAIRKPPAFASPIFKSLKLRRSSRCTVCSFLLK